MVLQGPQSRLALVATVTVPAALALLAVGLAWASKQRSRRRRRLSQLQLPDASGCPLEVLPPPPVGEHSRSIDNIEEIVVSPAAQVEIVHYLPETPPTSPSDVVNPDIPPVKSPCQDFGEVGIGDSTQSSEEFFNSLLSEDDTVLYTSFDSESSEDGHLLSSLQSGNISDVDFLLGGEIKVNSLSDSLLNSILNKEPPLLVTSQEIKLEDSPVIEPENANNITIGGDTVELLDKVEIFEEVVEPLIVSLSESGDSVQPTDFCSSLTSDKVKDSISSNSKEVKTEILPFSENSNCLSEEITSVSKEVSQEAVLPQEKIVVLEEIEVPPSTDRDSYCQANSVELTEITVSSRVEAAKTEVSTELVSCGVGETTEHCCKNLVNVANIATVESLEAKAKKFISDKVIITENYKGPANVVKKEEPVVSSQVPKGKQAKANKKGKKGKKGRASMERGELAEKLATLELDTMKLRKQSTSRERDSANHSPSDGMLASPTGYSDAHSEGSSDSGKGHSDVATPAGGSSLAGDDVTPSTPTIYEFLVPQSIVGRLIGRYGSFLQEIMATSHTNIFIKKHPESSKLKICAIEGCQPDIDKALEIIRKKFPARRYPKLTLDQVSFVNSEPQLRPEDFYLPLVEGVYNDVVVSSLMSGGHLFVQQPSHPSYLALTSLTQAMNIAYSDPSMPAPPPLLEKPIKDAVCVAPSMGGWYRVQVVDVNAENGLSDIKFVDYGGYLNVDSQSLRQIRADFLMLPFQAVECCLANIAPKSGVWSEEARMLTHHLTFGRVLQAQVVGYTDDTAIPLINLYTSFGNQVLLLVNDELVKYGFADPVINNDQIIDSDQESVVSNQIQQQCISVPAVKGL